MYPPVTRMVGKDGGLAPGLAHSLVYQALPDVRPAPAPGPQLGHCNRSKLGAKFGTPFKISHLLGLHNLHQSVVRDSLHADSQSDALGQIGVTQVTHGVTN